MPFSSRRRSRTRKRFEDEPPIVYLREADYDRERKKKGYVGSTWPASSSEYADHEAYHNLMDLRKAAKKNFRASETQAHYDFDSMTEGDEKKRRYYRSTGNLFPRQHTSLMPSADAWEGTEYRSGAAVHTLKSTLTTRRYSHANARADFMDKYPYSYRTVQGWKDHQGYVRAAYTDHENALRQYNWHGQYASSVSLCKF